MILFSHISWQQDGSLGCQCFNLLLRIFEAIMPPGGGWRNGPRRGRPSAVGRLRMGERGEDYLSMSQGRPFTLNVASTSSGRFLSKRTSSRGREPECGISFIPGFHIRAKLRPAMHARISNAPASITCSSNISAHPGSVVTSNAFWSSTSPVRFSILEAVAGGSSEPGLRSTSAPDGKTAEIPFMASKRSNSPSLWPLNLQDADHSPR